MAPASLQLQALDQPFPCSVACRGVSSSSVSRRNWVFSQLSSVKMCAHRSHVESSTTKNGMAWCKTGASQNVENPFSAKDLSLAGVEFVNAWKRIDYEKRLTVQVMKKNEVRINAIRRCLNRKPRMR